MSAPSDVPPIDDKESLYRKISVASGWYDPATGQIAFHAMRPLEFDTTGLSFDRADLRRPEVAARGRSKKGYFLAVILVSAIRQQGMTVVPVPIIANLHAGEEENLAHAEIPELTYANREEAVSIERMRVVRIEIEPVASIAGGSRWLWEPLGEGQGEREEGAAMVLAALRPTRAAVVVRVSAECV